VKRILPGPLYVLLALAVLYAGDYLSARYRLPGDRQTLGSVEVKTMWAIKQKDGRIDYELGDTETQTCLRSLFPHLGYTPCWYLTGHARKVIKVGRAGHRNGLWLGYSVNSCLPLKPPEPIFC
jgi:hypothetical protein